MAEQGSAIHFCPLLPAPAGARQKSAENVKTQYVASTAIDVGEN